MGSIFRFASSLWSALVAACLLLAGLFHQDAYADAGYGFSVLAVVGAIGCLGCLLTLVSRRRLPTVSGGLLPVPSLPTRRTKVPGEDWPLLVALLFGPFFVLLAGLGGWVYSGTHKHRSSDS